MSDFAQFNVERLLKESVLSDFKFLHVFTNQNQKVDDKNNSDVALQQQNTQFSNELDKELDKELDIIFKTVEEDTVLVENDDKQIHISNNNNNDDDNIDEKNAKNTEEILENQQQSTLSTTNSLAVTTTVQESKKKPKKKTMGEMLREMDQNEKRIKKEKKRKEREAKSNYITGNIAIVDQATLEERLRKKKKAKLAKAANVDKEYIKDTTTMSKAKYHFICGIFAWSRTFLDLYLELTIRDRKEYEDALAELRFCKEADFSEVYGYSAYMSTKGKNFKEVVVEELLFRLEQKSLHNAKKSIQLLLDCFNVYRDTFNFISSTTLIACQENFLQALNPNLETEIAVEERRQHNQEEKLFEYTSIIMNRYKRFLIANQNDQQLLTMSSVIKYISEQKYMQEESKNENTSISSTTSTTTSSFSSIQNNTDEEYSFEYSFMDTVKNRVAQITMFFEFFQHLLLSFEEKKKYSDTFTFQHILAILNRSAEFKNEIKSISVSAKPPCALVVFKRNDERKYRFFNGCCVGVASASNVKETVETHEFLRQLFSKYLPKDRVFLFDTEESDAIVITTRTANAKFDIGENRRIQLGKFAGLVAEKIPGTRLYTNPDDIQSTSALIIRNAEIFGYTKKRESVAMTLHAEGNFMLNGLQKDVDINVLFAKIKTAFFPYLVECLVESKKRWLKIENK